MKRGRRVDSVSMIALLALPFLAGASGDGCVREVPIGEEYCGNGLIEEWETCDPEGLCPTICDDRDLCTSDFLEGNSENCDARCVFDPIVDCIDDDGCCPDSCDWTTDNDCEEFSCEDVDVCSSGDGCCPDRCDFENDDDCDPPPCTEMTPCINGDDCCPSTCAGIDSDCSGICNNDGIRDFGEQCDGEDLGGRTCFSIGAFRGELRCSGGCELDFSGCDNDSFRWIYPQPQGNSLEDSFTTDDGQIFLVGRAGTIIHFDGTTWEIQRTPSYDFDLYGIYGFSSDDIYAVGEPSVVLHYDGDAWTQISEGALASTSYQLLSVWGSDPDDLWVSSTDGNFLHFDGFDWVEIEHEYDVRRLWGSSTDNIFGSYGYCSKAEPEGYAMARYNGESWSGLTNIDYDNLYPYSSALFGTSENEIFFAFSEEVGFFDGTSFTFEALPDPDFPNEGTLFFPTDVWGTHAENLYVTGNGGRIFYRSSTGWERIFVLEDFGDQVPFLGTATGMDDGAILAGDFGTILRAVDGEASYMSQKMEIGRVHDAIAFPDRTLVIVGEYGAIHYEGSGYSVFIHPIFDPQTYLAVWGTSPNDLYALTTGSVMHYNGSGWSQHADIVCGGIGDIWGSSSENIFVACGDGLINHFNGESWTLLEALDFKPNAIWGSGPNDVYVVGAIWVEGHAYGMISHYDGSVWESVELPFDTTPDPSPETDLNVSLYSVWGSGPDDVFIAGGAEAGSDVDIIWHYDGHIWYESYVDTDRNCGLKALWSGSVGRVIAGGTNCLLEYTGEKWEDIPFVSANGVESITGYPSSGAVFVSGGTVLMHDEM